MNKLLWSCAALLTLFVAVSSLTCNTCDVSILGYCAGTTPVTCTGNQNRCYSGIAKRKTIKHPRQLMEVQESHPTNNLQSEDLQSDWTASYSATCEQMPLS
ncbi:uncharacterized protein LOC129350733 isoform X2 [Amphiprion ocellaris]|uniref:uncharacterized protein LOC129350733 isoform X2 n=1 Tax=Amphiprion ocellaris TaxID=80972 RepID=UPI0024117AF7|nr:uncharacterized protein LOC129350733 isoform X2 [Amphiprion ocellaris]